MAVVGEATILVKALTTGFDADLKRQLKGMSGSIGGAGRDSGDTLGKAFSKGFNRGSGNFLHKIADGLRAIAPEAESARLQFRSLVRTGYTVGTAFGTIVGAIGSLVGGLITLVGAVGRAAPALMGIASAAVQMRLAFAGASFALGGIGAAVAAATKQNQGLSKSVEEIAEEWQQLGFQAEQAALSEERAALNLESALENMRRTADLPPNSAARREAKLAYDEAELAYRMAKDRTQDLNEELQKGPEALNKASGSDPYAGLTESQANFARFLVGLRPKLDTLKEAVASGFLPVLQDQIQELVDSYFPDLEQKFEDLGTALGSGTEKLFDNFLDENTKAEVMTFFDNLNKNIPTIGAILGEIGEILFKVFNDADGIGTKFLDWVLKSLEDWNTKLEENGLVQFFEDAYATGTDLFGIIGNVFNGLGDFFTILNDSGAMGTILGYFTDATGDFANLIDENGNVSESGKALGETFKGMADNFAPIMTVLGDMLDLFFEMGANPAVGDAFKKLADPANKENWSNILTAMVEAGPALADLVVTIGEIMAGFADAEAPKAFFDTIREIITPLAEWISDADNKAMVDMIGKLFAQISAVTFVLGVARFGLMVFIGNIIWIFTALGNVFKYLKAILGGVWKAFKWLGSGILKLFKGVGTLFARFLPLLKSIGTFVRVVVVGAFQLFGTVVKAVMTVLWTVVRTVAMAIGRALLAILGPWGLVIAAVVAGLTWFFTQTELGRELWSKFMDFLKGLWDGLVEKLEMVAGFFADLFEDPMGTIKSAWVLFMNFLIAKAEGFINFFIDGMNGLMNGPIEWVNGLNIPNIPKIPINLIPKVSLPRIPELATGGIVSPSAGGTLARIAEAGRPERVEPLDANGLSKRDYAMIEAMRSGGGGINITVNPSPGMDEKELAAAVSRRLAFEIRKGTI